MVSPRDRLRPYVSGLALQWLDATPQAKHKKIEGSLAFVDISGFTTLTERLAAKGKVGAEEMSDLLNMAFAELLARAYRYGASLVKWGGDAVLLLFEDAEHAALACRAADEMRSTMRRVGRLHTSVGVVQLKMSVGINSGEFDFFLVGSHHHELLVAGPEATRTALMEQTAEAGEIVVSAATAELLPPGGVGDAKGDGFLLLKPPHVAPRSRYWTQSVQPADIGSCLDPAIREQLVSEVGESEHRQVAVGFVEVSGVDDLLSRQGPGAVAATLQDLLGIVQDECAHHRVTFWETDISADGFKIMLVAGAPRSTGHDEEGMLRAARSILDKYDRAARVRIGVNSGRVFSGGFGPSFRRTWSVKGDAVNLAARVMGKAQHGQLLATEQLLRRVSATVTAELLPPFMVKGKKLPVRAAAVEAVSLDRSAGSTRSSAFIGRQREMDAMMAAQRSAAAGHGAALAVVGEPGVGKSRLVDHACSRFADGTIVLRGFADAYESATPYFAVRRLLRAAIGLAPAATDDEVLKSLRGQRAVAAQWLPLLAAPFGLAVADTVESAEVRDEFRRTRTVALVIDLLAEVLSSTTALVVDDVHDADEASTELLAQIAAEAVNRPWLLVLAGREIPTALAALADLRRIDLPVLDDGEAREFVLDSPGGESLSPHSLRAILERGEGNPLFLRELTAAAATADGDDLPTSIEDLLAARIDDLAPGPRRLLRAVSVLGVRFDETLVNGLLDDDPTDNDWRALDHVLARHPDGSRRFRTTLARDAAYEGLPYRRRVELHGRTAAALKRRAADRDEEMAEALSLHCLAAQLYDDAWRYSNIAGDRAQRMYANVDALVSYRRAREAARNLPGLPREQIAGLAETIGDLHARLAELDAATAAYREARRLAPPQAHAIRARVAFRAAVAATRAGHPQGFARWLGKVDAELDRAAAAGVTEPALAELRARATVERAFLLFRQGAYADAIKLASVGLGEAESADVPLLGAKALWVLDIAAMATGRAGDDVSIQRALDLGTASGDLPTQALMQKQLGVHAYYRGEWSAAAEHYEAARAVYDRAGDDWNALGAAINVGEIMVDQGRLAEAEPLVAEPLRAWRASGTPWDIGFAAALLGRLRSRSGRHAEGIDLLTEAISAYRVSNYRFDAIDAELGVVEAFLLQASPYVALDRLRETERELVAAARAAGMTEVATLEQLPDSVPHLSSFLRMRGYVAGQLGERSTALESFQRSLTAARLRQSTHDVALAAAALVWLSPEATEARAERDELFRQLGIVWVPVMPTATALPTEISLDQVPVQRATGDEVATGVRSRRGGGHQPAR